ncbi:polymer-forming cytoskeletal protein [Escherichia coli]|nr:hypothetical protein GP665_23270 [Escherichia coli]
MFLEWTELIALVLIFAFIFLPFFPALQELYSPRDSEALCLDENKRLSRSGNESEGREMFLQKDGECVVFPGALFKHLTASCIRIAGYSGNYPSPSEKYSLEQYTLEEAQWYSEQRYWYSKKDIIIPPGVYVDGDMISEGNVILGESSVISGAVKAGRDMELRAQARVKGCCTANNIRLFYAAGISGCAVASQRIHMMELSWAGDLESPVSVVANEVLLMPGVRIYGGINAHKHVKVSDADEEYIL